MSGDGIRAYVEVTMDAATATVVIFACLVGLVGALMTFPRGRTFLKKWFEDWLRFGEWGS
jgi:hypothetical protein